MAFINSFKQVLFVTLQTLILKALAASCSINSSNAQVNGANPALIVFTPNSGSQYAEDYLIIRFPVYLGMTIDSATFNCSPISGGSMYISGTPVCTIEVGDNSEPQVRVANLKTGTFSSYTLSLTGFVNGPVAKSNKVDATIG